jgi:hypothetical protein
MREKAMRPCPNCGSEFGARELREHKGACRRELKNHATASIQQPANKPVPLGLGVTLRLRQRQLGGH